MYVIEEMEEKGTTMKSLQWCIIWYKQYKRYMGIFIPGIVWIYITCTLTSLSFKN